MINLFKKKEPKWHWYKCKLSYRDKTNKELFWYYVEVGLVEQKDVLNDRALKVIDKPLHLNPAIKNFIKNGKIVVEDVSYLGHFGKHDKNKKKYSNYKKKKAKVEVKKRFGNNCFSILPK